MGSNFKILLVEDTESFRETVVEMLGVYNDVTETENLAQARSALKNGSFDVVLLDKGLPDGDGKDLIPEIKNFHPNTVVIVLTSDSDFSSIKHCISLGADDYVVKSENIVPDLLVRLPVTVSKAASQRRLKSLDQLVKDAFRYELVGKSVPTMELRESVLSLKGSEANVLITGESGTGKELVARRINAVEDDQQRAFVAVNCGAIPENLIESELFGHKKGSFTGATQDRIGKFELADGGDIFLDEVAELPQQAQVKLLRVIQEGEITRIGENRPIKVNCRVIAATNKNLEKMVKDESFREDLYHRLNVVRLMTSPLRERMTDIEDLAKLFVTQIGGSDYKICDTALRALREYDYPGNVRELRNIVERAVISVRRRKSKEIKFDDILLKNIIETVASRLKKISASLPEKLTDLTPESYEEFFQTLSQEYFKSALEASNGDVTYLAERIGVSRASIFRKIKNSGIDVKKFNRNRRLKEVFGSSESGLQENFI